MYKTIGGLLAAVRVCWIIYTFSMDVTVGYSDNVI